MLSFKLLLLVLPLFIGAQEIQRFRGNNLFKRYYEFVNARLQTSEIPDHCSLVFVHENERELESLPEFYSTLSRPWLELILPENFTTEVTEENATFPYPWPAPNPDAPSIGNCAVYVIFFSDVAKLDKLLEYIPNQFSMVLQRDYFILLKELNMDQELNDIEQILIHSSFTASLKYKILPIFNENGTLDIYTVCFYCENGEPKVIQLPRKDDSLPSTLFPDFTWDLKGKHIVVSYNVDVTKRQIEKHLSDEPIRVPIDQYVFLIFSDCLNFDFKIMRHPLGEAAFLNMQNEDNTWEGHSQAILAGDAQLAPGLYDTVLMKYVDMSVPITSSNFRIILPKPQHYFTPWAIVIPFDFWLWVCIFILISIAGVIYAVFLKSLETSRFYRDLSSSETYGYTLFFLFYSMLGWSSPSLPSSSPSRVFVIFWLLYGIIITFFYQSVMTSMMTVPEMEVQPKTFKDLVDMDYKYAADGYMQAIFQLFLLEVEVEYLLEIRDSVIGYEKLENCLSDALKNRKLACISIKELYGSPMLKFLDDDYLPALYPVFSDGIPISGSILYSKSFIPAKSLNKCMRTLSENGYFQYHDSLTQKFFVLESIAKKRAIERLKPDQSQKYAKGEVPLKRSHFQGAYLVLLIGLGVAGLVFLKEMLRFKCSKNMSKMV